MANNTVAPDGSQASQIDLSEGALQRIQQAVMARILPLETHIGTALSLLEQDIDNSELEALSQQNHDIFILRANRVGLGLLNRRAYYQATVVYEALIRRVEEFIRASGKARHVGALKANLGVSYILIGNFDAGVSLLLETATRDDVVTYRINDPSTSYAITLLRDVLLRQVISHVASVCNQKFNIVTGRSLGPEAISTMANHQNPLGEVTFVSLIPLLQHSTWQQRASTPYGRVRVLDGLRWLSAMLESMVVFIGLNSLDPDTQRRFQSEPRMTLWQAYSNLFRGRNWWGQAQQMRDQGAADTDRNDSDQDIVDKYRRLLAMPETTHEELLLKTVLISTLTRNFAMHHLEAPGLVINQVGQEIIQYLLLTQVTIFDWAYQEGHFNSLAQPGVWPR
jgi:hypothetical protein